MSYPMQFNTIPGSHYRENDRSMPTMNAALPYVSSSPVANPATSQNVSGPVKNKQSVFDLIKNFMLGNMVLAGAGTLLLGGLIAIWLRKGKDNTSKQLPTAKPAGCDSRSKVKPQLSTITGQTMTSARNQKTTSQTHQKSSLLPYTLPVKVQQMSAEEIEKYYTELEKYLKTKLRNEFRFKAILLSSYILRPEIYKIEKVDEQRKAYKRALLQDYQDHGFKYIEKLYNQSERDIFRAEQRVACPDSYYTKRLDA